MDTQLAIGNENTIVTELTEYDKAIISVFSNRQQCCRSCVGGGSPFPTTQEYHYKQ